MIEGLSLRKRQVIVGIARSKTRKEIAGDLGMNIHTIDYHMKTICRKLSLPDNDIAGITRFAIATGMVKLWADKKEDL